MSSSLRLILSIFVIRTISVATALRDSGHGARCVAAVQNVIAKSRVPPDRSGHAVAAGTGAAVSSLFPATPEKTDTTSNTQRSRLIADLPPALSVGKLSALPKGILLRRLTWGRSYYATYCACWRAATIVMNAVRDHIQIFRSALIYPIA
jgi:hypothetical protein